MLPAHTLENANIISLSQANSILFLKIFFLNIKISGKAKASDETPATASRHLAQHRIEIGGNLIRATRTIPAGPRHLILNTVPCIDDAVLLTSV